jgi:hypothetical protein
MKTKQTAVEWLFLKMNRIRLDYEIGNLNDLDFIENQKKAYKESKQMEKEQINKAWENGFRSTGEGWNGEIPPECQGEVLDTEEYYNETYGPQVDKK